MYAPIIIFTLNRAKHLKRCVESLLQNREACYTDIYISVDYPPYPKYMDGYSEVMEYVKTITGFREVHLYFQERNLGPGLNSKFLRDEVEKEFDRFIIAEDDNEFSPDFLKYMNWGLNEFENDENIYAICSTADFPVVKGMGNADYMKLPAYNAYGVGHWYNKYNKCIKYLKDKDVNDIYRSKRIRNELYSISPMIYRWVALDSLRKEPAMRSKNDELTNIDIWRNVYCIDNKLVCIIPVESRSRNWGMDGTGIHATQEQKEDFIPDVIFDDNLMWPDNPRCMSSDDCAENLISHAKRFAISDADRRKSTFVYGANKLFGNKAVLSSYNKARSIYHKLRRWDNAETEGFEYI